MMASRLFKDLFIKKASTDLNLGFMEPGFYMKNIDPEDWKKNRCYDVDQPYHKKP